MERIAVRSSNLVSIGYSEQDHVLEVEFRHGEVYQYAGVPKDVYDMLMATASPGYYFDTMVKKGHYPYKVMNNASE